MPEVNGCVAAEGFPPGYSQLDTTVYDADTGEPLGPLRDLIGESASPSAGATAPGGDIDCDQVDGPIYVGPNDPHNLDGNGDGWGCEE